MYTSVEDYTSSLLPPSFSPQSDETSVVNRECNFIIRVLIGCRLGWVIPWLFLITWMEFYSLVPRPVTPGRPLLCYEGKPNGPELTDFDRFSSFQALFWVPLLLRTRSRQYISRIDTWLGTEGKLCWNPAMKFHTEENSCLENPGFWVRIKTISWEILGV